MQVDYPSQKFPPYLKCVTTYLASAETYHRTITRL